MKKFAFIAAAILLIAGATFALSKTDLLQGAFVGGQNFEDMGVNDQGGQNNKGDSDYITLAQEAADEAYGYMLLAEEALDYAVAARTAAHDAADAGDATTKENQAGAAQTYADSAAGHAADARDAANRAQDYADLNDTEMQSGGIDPMDPEEVGPIVNDPHGIHDFGGIDTRLPFLLDLGVWNPDVTQSWVDIETQAEDFFTSILIGNDLAAFEEGGDYYNFLMSVYTEGYNLDPNENTNEIGAAYTQGLLNLETFESDLATNANVMNGVNQIQMNTIQMMDQQTFQGAGMITQ
jgi:hypothetical protein